MSAGFLMRTRTFLAEDDMWRDHIADLSISEIESASDTYRHRHSLMYNHCMIVAWLLVITKGLQSKDLDHDGLNETLIDIVSK